MTRTAPRSGWVKPPGPLRGQPLAGDLLAYGGTMSATRLGSIWRHRECPRCEHVAPAGMFRAVDVLKGRPWTTGDMKRRCPACGFKAPTTAFPVVVASSRRSVKRYAAARPASTRVNRSSVLAPCTATAGATPPRPVTNLTPSPPLSCNACSPGRPRVSAPARSRSASPPWGSRRRAGSSGTGTSPQSRSCCTTPRTRGRRRRDDRAWNDGAGNGSAYGATLRNGSRYPRGRSRRSSTRRRSPPSK
jgi:hypothetical protein